MPEGSRYSGGEVSVRPNVVANFSGRPARSFNYVIVSVRYHDNLVRFVVMCTSVLTAE